MAYNSVNFFLFLFLLLVIYFLMPNAKARRYVILAGNIVFYQFAGLDKLMIVIGTSAVVYLTSRMIEKIYSGYEEEKKHFSPKEQVSLMAGYKKRCRKWLYFALLCVIGILLYVKVGKMYGWPEANSIRDFRAGYIIVPLGLSYYTFSSVGYLLDIYWRKIPCEHNYLKLLTCMTYFPHIVEGPISKYQMIMKQFDSLPGFQYQEVCFGLQLFLWGAFKKMVVADRLAVYVNVVANDLTILEKYYAGTEVFLAVIFGAIQLYADFSGCMDMMCGISQAMGISLDKNFNRPFFARSGAEFWRRWHITLGTWFKDYVYMPIAISPWFIKMIAKVRKRFGGWISQNFATAVPLVVVWLLTGAWHGNGKSYIAWGMYWGFVLIMSNLLSPGIKRINSLLHIRSQTFGFKLFQMLRTFLLFCIGRTFTMARTLHGCLNLWQCLFREHRLWVLFDGSLYSYGLDQKDFHIALAGVILIMAVDCIQERGIHIREAIAKNPLPCRWIIYYGAIILVLVLGMYGTAYNASDFIYGGF